MTALGDFYQRVEGDGGSCSDAFPCKILPSVKTKPKMTEMCKTSTAGHHRIEKLETSTYSKMLMLA